MKYLISIIVLFGVVTAHSDTQLSFLGGSLVYHPFAENTHAFSNRIAPDSDIISPLFLGLGLRYLDESTYTRYTLFGGQNSFSSPMVGGAFGVGHAFEFIDMGLTIGSFFQKPNNYLPSSIVPFMGLDLSAKFPLSQNVTLTLNSLASFQLMNLFLGLGFAL